MNREHRVEITVALTDTEAWQFAQSAARSQTKATPRGKLIHRP